jgi:hypothetical protein
MLLIKYYLSNPTKNTSANIRQHLSLKDKTIKGTCVDMLRQMLHFISISSAYCRPEMAHKSAGVTRSLFMSPLGDFKPTLVITG